MTKRPNFRVNITTRYGKAEKCTYDDVMALAKKWRMSKSRTQLMLIRHGLQYFRGFERRLS